MSTDTTKPMDPKRLADMRARLAMHGLVGNAKTRNLCAELLADRDYHAQRADEAERERDEARQLADDATALLAAEVRRLRARVRVEAEDVERAGVTRAHLEAWLRANQWAPTTESGWKGFSDGSTVSTQTWRPAPYNARGVTIEEWDRAEAVVNSIRTMAYHLARPGLDILDEMAAMELGHPSTCSTCGGATGRTVARYRTGAGGESEYWEPCPGCSEATK